MGIGCRCSKVLLVLVQFYLLIFPIFNCSGKRDESFDRLKSRGYMVFAVCPNYPPFCFYDRKNNLVGFDIDIAEEISKRLGIKAKIEEAELSSMIKGLQSYKFDAVHASLSITDERATTIDFSIPYYHTRSIVMVKSGSDMRDVSMFAGKKIGVEKNTLFETYGRVLKPAALILYDKNEDALMALHRGVIDAVITDEIVGLYLKKRMGLLIEPAGNPLGQEKIALVFRKGEAELVHRVNKTIEAIQKDGTSRLLVEKIMKDAYGR